MARPALHPDEIPARLRAAAADRGVSLAALSSMLGRRAGYLQGFVKRRTPRVLADADRRLLADFFGLPADHFDAIDVARPAGGPR